MYYSKAYIFFKKKLYQHNMLTVSYHFRMNLTISFLRYGVLMFQNPMVLLFFPNYNFYNGSCPPLVVAIKTQAHEIRASNVLESNILLPYFNIYKHNIVKCWCHLINTVLMSTRNIYTHRFVSFLIPLVYSRVWFC